MEKINAKINTIRSLYHGGSPERKEKSNRRYISHTAQCSVSLTAGILHKLFGQKIRSELQKVLHTSTRGI